MLIRTVSLLHLRNEFSQLFIALNKNMKIHVYLISYKDCVQISEETGRHNCVFLPLDFCMSTLILKKKKNTLIKH